MLPSAHRPRVSLRSTQGYTSGSLIRAPHTPHAVPPAAIDAFAPARAWFAAQGYAPFAFQEEVWAAYARGASGLIHAPTGMGKTYAAALPPMLSGPAGAPDAAPPLSLL